MNVMSFNFHPSAIKIIADCKTYSHARRRLKLYGLTKKECDFIITLAKQKGFNLR